MIPQQFVITVALGSSLISLQYAEGLNYVMVNILELNQSSADDNETSVNDLCKDDMSSSEFLLTGNDKRVSNMPPDTAYTTDVQSPFGSLPPTPANDDGVSDVPPVHTANMTDGPPTFGPMGTVHSTQDPSTIIPPSTDDSVTTFPAEAPVLPNSNPPLCSRVINITWLSLPPFIFQSNDNTDVKTKKSDGKLTGVFYGIIERAVQYCCKYLDNKGTRLQYAHKAENKETLHANIFHHEPSMGMPVYIENEFFDIHYGGQLSFIKVLESPGLVVIGNKDNAKESDLNVLWKAIYDEWPIVFISLLLCAISDIFIWALDTTWNKVEFPRRFHRGACEGFWWAFVTMSTVGYGDKAPKSVIARVFCILWIMVGLTLCSVMTATLTTALATAAVKDVDLVGKKIAVLRGSPVFEEVVRRGGSPKLFENFNDMHNALVLNKTVTGIMDEMYHGLYWMQQDKLSVAKEDEEVNVLGGNSTAFRILVISLTILLGALIGAILFFELLLYLYQRFTNKHDAEAKAADNKHTTSVRQYSSRDEFLDV